MVFMVLLVMLMLGVCVCVIWHRFTIVWIEREILFYFSVQKKKKKWEKETKKCLNLLFGIIWFMYILHAVMGHNKDNTM